MKTEPPSSPGATVPSAALVEQLVHPEGWPEPQVLAAILERGDESGEPLRALLARSYTEWPEIASLGFAAALLASLGDTVSIPAVLSLVRRLEGEVLDDLARALGHFGPQIIEPALDLARDESLDPFCRAAAIDGAMYAAADADDPGARGRLATVLGELLAANLSKVENAHAAGKVDPEVLGDGHKVVTMSTLLVIDLADLADPRSRDVIDAAFRAGIVETFMIRPEDIEDAYRPGAKKTHAGLEPLLTRYERQYREHESQERRKAEAKQSPPAALPPQPAALPPRPAALPPRPAVKPATRPPAVEPIQKTEWRPRRNDPCWCGSGKKYKECHLRRDQA
jgi:hypothetical protein